MTNRSSTASMTPPPLPNERRDPLWDDILTGKNFFRVGLGLVLLALVFLFRYAVQAGWIGPAARVGAGAVVSISLIAYGAVLARTRPSYGQLLAGGGVAGLYVTAFAAHHVYAMTGLTVAFIQLVAVATLGVGLALRWDSEPLALSAFAGALVAPLLIEGRMLPGFGGDAVYFAAVIAGVVITAMRNDWRLLYWTTSAGSALVIAFEAFRREVGQIGAPDRLELQLMVATVWAGFFVVPVVARILQRGIGEAQAWYGTLVVSPASFLATWFVWRDVLADRSLALVALGMALAHGGLALAARRDDQQLAVAQLLPAAALVGMAAVLAFDGPIVAVVLLAEAAGLISVGRTMDVEVYEAAGHVLFLGSGLWLLRVIPDLGEATVPIINGDFLALLALPALAGWTAWSIGHDGDATERALAGAYALFGAFALVAGLWVELGAVSQALVTVSYATLAVALLAFGMARDSRMLARTGLVGLAAVVVKLFIVDLAAAEPIWKIGAFSGIGLVLLVVGLWISNDD